MSVSAKSLFVRYVRYVFAIRPMIVRVFKSVIVLEYVALLVVVNSHGISVKICDF